MENTSAPSTGFDYKPFLRTLTPLPGVYCMLDNKGRVLYVGKARNLKRRVSSYFRANQPSAKTRRLVARIRAVEVTVTHTEGEALILESHLIEKFRPRFNLMMRDGRGYPFLHLSEEDFPRLSVHWGAPGAGGRYFGPFPSTPAVYDTLDLLQKVFRLRQCEDRIFRHRDRPCLLYQIKRCSAPCTSVISREQYQGDVSHVARFLSGRSSGLIDDLARHMGAASAELRFEDAAKCRDQIIQLRRIQERQHVSGQRGDLDVVACAARGGAACVQALFFRGGRLLGGSRFFQRVLENQENAYSNEDIKSHILGIFFNQHYLSRDAPGEIVLDRGLLQNRHLAQLMPGRRVTFARAGRGERGRWLEMAAHNAEDALRAHLSGGTGMRWRLAALGDALGLGVAPSRLECLHLGDIRAGATAVGCVVYDQDGPVTSGYRHYTVGAWASGDERGVMRRVLGRRYSPQREAQGKLPDILLMVAENEWVDEAREALAALGVGRLAVVGAASASGRDPGSEVLYLSRVKRPIILSADSPASDLVRQIRDDAYRCAVAGHSRRRQKVSRASVLDSVPGIGRMRRQLLLTQFGSVEQLARAGVGDLTRVKGISRDLAQRVYDVFHGERWKV